jgi:phosphopantetheinyl transferase
VVKALGTGLAIDLRSFEAFAETSRFAPVMNLDGWFVTAVDAGDRYHCAVAARRPSIVLVGQVPTQ